MNEIEYKKIIKNIKKEKDYEEIEGILYRKKEGKRLQVIRRFELEGIMYLCHDHVMAGHFGIKATYERIKERYYWPKIKEDVEEYVKTCNECQRRGKPRGKNELRLIKVENHFIRLE